MFVRFRLRAKGRMHFCIPVDLGTPHQRVLWDAKSLHGQEKKKKKFAPVRNPLQAVKYRAIPQLRILRE